MKKKLGRIVTTIPFAGLLYMIVCAEKDITDEEILEFCNKDNLCGTTNGWCYVIRKLKDTCGSKTDTQLPIQCKDYEDRIHFMVGC